MTSLILFHVQDPTAIPIGGALLSAKSPNGDWQGVTNLCGDFPAELTPGHYDITISASGFTDRLLPADLANCGIVTIGLERSSHRPTPIPHAPLPPWDPSDSGGQVHTTPPPELIIPSTYDPLWLRADFNGITLNLARWGIPTPPAGQTLFNIVGANSTPAAMIMSPMLILYPRSLQDAWLTESAERNYSHVVIASDGWNFQQNGFSPTTQQIVDWAKYVQSWGNYCVYWGPAAADNPFLSALADAHAVDFHIVGEEVDGKVTAQQYAAILDNALSIYAGPTAAHFTSNYPDGFPKDTFFDGRSMPGFDHYDGKVHLMWQADQNESAGTQGARLYYARERVNIGGVSGSGNVAPNCRVYAYETMATAQLNGKCTEEYGNLRDLELLYTTRTDPRIPAVGGFGNGCRYPDGRPV